MRATGDAFERRACAELTRAGLILLSRNYATRHGEIDLVMRDGACIVFVEVRYRRNATHGSGLESITPSKRHRLILAARQWLANHPSYATHACRFDVVGYTHASVQWLKNAFESV